MALNALLFAHHGVGPEGEPPATFRVAGMSVIERQVRQARASGAARVIVVVERMPPALAAALDRANVEIARAATGITLADDDRVLVIGDSMIVDQKIVEAVLEREPPALAIWKGRAAHDGAERIDPTSHWAAVALYSGRLVADTLAALGEWDLQATLLRAAGTGAKPTRIDVGTLGVTGEPLVWRPVRSRHEADHATDVQLRAGDTERRDWPSRLLHAPVEDRLVPKLLTRQVTPAALLAAALAFSLGGVVAFAAGGLLGGLALAIVSGPVFGVSMRVARARDASPLFRLRWTAAALAGQCGWYLALAAHFSRTHEPVGPSALAALMVIAVCGDAAIQVAYRRLAGRALDKAGNIERLLRLFGGHRNSLLWALLPFGVVGAWWPGFIVVAVYATATYLASAWRAFVRLTAPATPVSIPVPDTLPLQASFPPASIDPGK